MKRRIIYPLLVLAAVLLLASFATQAVQKPQTSISISGGAMTVTADAADIYIRIGGPDGYFREVRGRDFAQWRPDSGAVDGHYRYDCYVSAGVPRDGSVSEAEMEAALEASSTSAHGVFDLQDGILTGDDENAPAVSPDDNAVPDFQGMHQPDEERGNLLWNAIGGLLDLLVPPAHALNTINDDVQINGYLYVVGTGGSGYLNYNDTTSDLYLSGGSYYMLDTAPKFFVYDESTTDYNWYFDFNDATFKLVDTVGANVNNAISITAQSGTTNSNNSFVVDTLGDIGLADNAVFIDRSADEVGIGTLSPAGSLHIMDDALPELILEDTGAGSTRWELEASTVELHVYGYNSTSFTSVYPFRINNNAKSNTLALGNLLTGTNNVGMGTNDPETGLHMLHYDGNGIIKVQEQNAVVQKRIQVQLENNGPTGFKFTDTSNGAAWTTSMLPGGGFTFSFVGTGGGEFQITPGGRVTMGPGPAINFDLTQTGDLDIPNGEVSAVAFNTVSSRNAKRNFEQLDSKAVMQKLSELDISEWEYRNPNVKGRHIGPVAEEFHALFGLGDSDKRITPSDMAGIGLLAAKSLQEENAKMQAAMSNLEAENSDLKARLARLEALVGQLAAGE